MKIGRYFIIVADPLIVAAGPSEIRAAAKVEFSSELALRNEFKLFPANI